MHRVCGKNMVTDSEANIRFISVEAREKEQQKNESGNKDYGRYKVESPHVNTYIKRRKGLKNIRLSYLYLKRNIGYLQTEKVKLIIHFYRASLNGI